MMERSGRKRKDKEERMVEDEKGKRKTGRVVYYIYMCVKKRERERHIYIYILREEKKKEERKRRDEGRPRPMIVEPT